MSYTSSQPHSDTESPRPSGTGNYLVSRGTGLSQAGSTKSSRFDFFDIALTRNFTESSWDKDSSTSVKYIAGNDLDEDNSGGSSSSFKNSHTSSIRGVSKFTEILPRNDRAAWLAATAHQEKSSNGKRSSNISEPSYFPLTTSDTANRGAQPQSGAFARQERLGTVHETLRPTLKRGPATTADNQGLRELVAARRNRRTVGFTEDSHASTKSNDDASGLVGRTVRDASTTALLSTGSNPTADSELDSKLMAGRTPELTRPPRRWHAPMVGWISRSFKSKTRGRKYRSDNGLARPGSTELSPRITVQAPLTGPATPPARSQEDGSANKPTWSDFRAGPSRASFLRRASQVTDTLLAHPSRRNSNSKANGNGDGNGKRELNPFDSEFSSVSQESPFHQPSPAASRALTEPDRIKSLRGLGLFSFRSSATGNTGSEFDLQPESAPWYGDFSAEAESSSSSSSGPPSPSTQARDPTPPPLPPRPLLHSHHSLTSWPASMQTLAPPLLKSAQTQTPPTIRTLTRSDAAIPSPSPQAPPHLPTGVGVRIPTPAITSPQADYFHVRVDVTNPDDATGAGDGEDLSMLDWDIPEHLPRSPLCPLSPKHRGGGGGGSWCPYHSPASAMPLGR